MAEYIEKEKVLDDWPLCDEPADAYQFIRNYHAADVRPVPEGGIGEMSDGYHTFNGLYYQRMVLFAALVIAHNDKAWKSWKHEDGEPCFGGGWFIVGIDTPQGSYTYHYEDKYWNWFECEELPVAKHWDGHTEEDVVRLLSLDVRPVVLCKDCVYWQKPQVRLNDGTYRDYEPGEYENGSFFGGVTVDVGINIGSFCAKYNTEHQNQIPQFMGENDFCSKGYKLREES